MAEVDGGLERAEVAAVDRRRHLARAGDDDPCSLALADRRVQRHGGRASLRQPADGGDRLRRGVGDDARGSGGGAGQREHGGREPCETPHVRHRTLFVVDMALKAALVGLLLFAVARQDLPQFHGKAVEGRAIAYPVAALVVPVAWWLRRRRHPTPYPFVLDILVVLPFFIDTLGNALNLYDTIGWWDDANHFVNWAILTAAFGQLLVRLPLTRWTAWGLAVGFGGVTAILWEFMEYVTFIRNSPELETAYRDTLGDLALGLSGSVLAATLTVTVLWPASRASPARPAPA